MKHLQCAAITALVTLAIPSGAAAQEAKNNAWGGRAFATLNVGAQTASPAFDYSYATTLFDQNANAALVTPGKSGLSFDVGAGVRVVQNLGVGVTYSRYSNTRTATLSTTIPNPYYPYYLYYPYNQYLPANPTSAVSQDVPLNREEHAVHIQAIYRIPLGSRLQLGAFGGPSYFRCIDDHVTKFALDATDYPAWVVSFLDVQQKIDRGSAWGYHGGASLTFLAHKHVGVGFTVRYSEAAHTTVNHLSDTSQLSNSGVWGGDTGTVTVKMKHGGIQWSGGVSFHF